MRDVLMSAETLKKYIPNFNRVNLTLDMACLEWFGSQTAATLDAAVRSLHMPRLADGPDREIFDRSLSEWREANGRAEPTSVRCFLCDRSPINPRNSLEPTLWFASHNQASHFHCLICEEEVKKAEKDLAEEKKKGNVVLVDRGESKPAKKAPRFETVQAHLKHQEKVHGHVRNCSFEYVNRILLLLCPDPDSAVPFFRRA